MVFLIFLCVVHPLYYEIPRSKNLFHIPRRVHNTCTWNLDREECPIGAEKMYDPKQTKCDLLVFGPPKIGQILASFKKWQNFIFNKSMDKFNENWSFPSKNWKTMAKNQFFFPCLSYLCNSFFNLFMCGTPRFRNSCVKKLVSYLSTSSWHIHMKFRSRRKPLRGRKNVRPKTDEKCPILPFGPCKNDQILARFKKW